jgi:hypothetical protein
MNEGAEREAALQTLAAKLFFRLEKTGSGYSLYRDVDVHEPVHREGLTLGEAEELLGTWKLRGEHGG